jgi:hypothetical protein
MTQKRAIRVVGGCSDKVHLANLFKKNYWDECFYSGEEVDLTDKEHSKEGKAEELRRDEP